MRIALPLIALAALIACADAVPISDPVKVIGKGPIGHLYPSCDLSVVLEVHPVSDTTLTVSLNSEFEVDFYIVNDGPVACENAANQIGQGSVTQSSLTGIDPYSWSLDAGDSVFVRAYFKASAHGSGTAEVWTDFSGFKGSEPVVVP